MEELPWRPLFSSFATNLPYNITMGVMAGNIIAAIPAVQLGVKSEIARGSMVVIAVIMSGCHIDATHAIADVAINETTIAFCDPFIK
jgi:hypothetical protein